MSPASRTVGRNGPAVPSIGYGAMSLGGVYGSDDTTEHKLNLLDRAWQIGARFWDTADIYASSESTIGEWFQKNPEKRKDIVLASKFACIFDPTTMSMSYRSDPEYIHESIEKSLGKLQTDYIDLYYCHRVDSKTPVEKTVGALVELINAGKIRHYGLSEVSADTIRRAHAVHPVAAVQVEYSPFCLDIEDPKIGVLDTCKELGIAVVAYSPVGRGLLTGQITSYDSLDENDFRRATPKYSRENFPKILQLVDEIKSIADKKGCTVAQVCLAWLSAQDELVIPIPGTRSIKYLEENHAALQVELTAEEVAEIRGYATAADIPGDRYPALMMSSLFADTPAL